MYTSNLTAIQKMQRYDSLDHSHLRYICPKIGPEEWQCSSAWQATFTALSIWPDPERIDRATRNHDGAGDFSEWLGAMRPVRRTVFIKRNHEDFAWLESQKRTEILPGLFYLPNGCRRELDGASDRGIRVGGIGGCYGPSDYSRRSKELQGYARRHYTHDEVDRLGTSGAFDLLLTRDAPAGIRFTHHRRGPGLR